MKKEIALVAHEDDAEELINLLEKRKYSYENGEPVKWSIYKFIQLFEGEYSYIAFFITYDDNDDGKNSVTYTMENDALNFKKYFLEPFSENIESGRIYLFENNTFKEIWKS